MPAWLVSVILNWAVPLAIKFGVPWLITKFPWLPQNLSDIIQNLVDEINGHKQQYRGLVKESKAKAREQFATVAVAPDIKRT